MQSPNPPTPVKPAEYIVPRTARPARCSSCGASIIWTRTSKNGRPIPLSAATIRTADNGDTVALPHFVDCPHAAQHRKSAAKPANLQLDLVDLPAYLLARHLVIAANRITDDGAGRLIVELFTRPE